MPLFMDYHKKVAETFDRLIAAHMKDLAVQEKYRVKYHKWWTNPKEGIIYCLMEGPNAAACEAVHREAHGEDGTACSIIEVDVNFFNIFMGYGGKTKNDAALHPDGSLDLGYRMVMLVELQSLFSYESESAHTARKLIAEEIAKHFGRVLSLPNTEMVSGVFSSSDDILQCAFRIQNLLSTPKRDFNFKIALSAGKPITEAEGFFTEALELVHALNNIALDGEIVASSSVKDLSKNGFDKVASVKFLHTDEEQLTVRLMKSINENLAEEKFTVDTLATQLGISRPQLYRKIVSLSGKSPNDLIRELRMKKARTLLKSKTDNVSQVALQVGYNNPSYFAKYFREKFGCSPSEFMHS